MSLPLLQPRRPRAPSANDTYLAGAACWRYYTRWVELPRLTIRSKPSPPPLGRYGGNDAVGSALCDVPFSVRLENGLRRCVCSVLLRSGDRAGEVLRDALILSGAVPMRHVHCLAAHSSFCAATRLECNMCICMCMLLLVVISNVGCTGHSPTVCCELNETAASIFS